MIEVGTVLAAVMFAAMGLASFARPVQVMRQFGTRELTVDGRNEVFAVYGGFGLAMAGTLLAAAVLPEIRTGVTLTLAMALGGMAFGRLVSLAVEGSMGRFPKLYLVIELLGAFLLSIICWAS